MSELGLRVMVDPSNNDPMYRPTIEKIGDWPGNPTVVITLSDEPGNRNATLTMSKPEAWTHVDLINAYLELAKSQLRQAGATVTGQDPVSRTLTAVQEYLTRMIDGSDT